MVFLIIIGFIALLAAAIWVINIFDYARQARYLLPLFAIAAITWLLALFAYNRALDYNENKCAKWAIETGYETKYVNIGYGDWACYGKVVDKWLPIERIRGIEND